MKKLLFGLLTIISATSFAQESSKILHLQPGNNTMTFQGRGTDIFDITAGNTNSTVFTPVFDSQLFNKLRVELYDESGNLLTSYIDSKERTKGPNATDYNPIQLSDSPFHTLEFSKDRIWPIIVGAIVLCCVKASVGSNGWSVGFDCNCLSGKSSSATVDVKINNKTFTVSRIKFVPLDSAGRDIPLIPSEWSMSVR